MHSVSIFLQVEFIRPYKHYVAKILTDNDICLEDNRTILSGTALKMKFDFYKSYCNTDCRCFKVLGLNLDFKDTIIFLYIQHHQIRDKAQENLLNGRDNSQVEVRLRNY